MCFRGNRSGSGLASTGTSPCSSVDSASHSSVSRRSPACGRSCASPPCPAAIRPVELFWASPSTRTMTTSASTIWIGKSWTSSRRSRLLVPEPRASASGSPHPAQSCQSNHWRHTPLASLELPEDLVGLREAVLLVFREDPVLPLVDVEDAARALHQLGVEALGLLDLRGQPDRVAFVASGRAVDDTDAHDSETVAPPPRPV